MMSPTFTNIRVRTTRDAEIIFHAYGKNVAAASPGLWNRALSVSQKEEVGTDNMILFLHVKTGKRW